ncbi:hypothetical protein [Phosphitispora sp. TUW77]|uniref:hypothetical protein n=1 Tax=Phosphitispora sp. TUW77 TaxID=3152361 RepID=UPI003AB918BA
MKNKNISVTSLVRYSLLASLTGLLQVSAALFPGPGNMLSFFSSLPIALAAFISPWGGVACTIISGWLTLLIRPVGLPAFALIMAPLGLVIGISLHYSTKPQGAILAGTAAVTTGLLFITYVLGFPAFGYSLEKSTIFAVLPFYASFSLIYNYAWYNFIKKVLIRLTKFIKL